MKDAVIYIHGKGGSASEAAHYVPLFPAYDVIGFDYQAQTPWEAEAEFPAFFDAAAQGHRSVTLIANSIGAYFSMCALHSKPIQKAYWISPIVDMDRLIRDRMVWANVSEQELFERGEIEAAPGEALSWEYLCYVRTHPIRWTAPTQILYGAHDALTPLAEIRSFAKATGAALTVMKDGEHWFHTEEQMRFLDAWIRQDTSFET